MMKIAFALVLALSVAGCAAAPPPFAGPDPSDAAVLVRPQQYRSVLAPYVPRRPVEPSGWPGSDERPAPRPGVTP